MSEAYTAARVEMVEQQQPQAQQEEEIPVLFLHDVERHYRQGDETLHVLNGVELALWGGQSVALVAPSGAGKVDAAAYRRPARASRPWRRLYRRPLHRDSGRPRAHPHPPQRDRLRLPVAPSAAGIHRARKRAAAADDPRPRDVPRPRHARSSCSDIWAWAGGSITGRRNCPAASSSAWRSRARSPMRRASCWPTSRPAISTCTPPTTCSTRCPSWCAPRASPPSSPPTTWISPPAWTGA